MTQVPVISEPHAKPQSREERLKKKREAERLRYARLKNDEEGRQRLREKESFKYAQKKKKGIIVPIKQLSEQAQRAKRKEWRNAKRKSELRKKMNEALDNKKMKSEYCN